jgi:hypothetical protein
MLFSDTMMTWRLPPATHQILAGAALEVLRQDRDGQAVDLVPRQVQATDRHLFLGQHLGGGTPLFLFEWNLRRLGATHRGPGMKTIIPQYPPWLMQGHPSHKAGAQVRRPEEPGSW